VDEQVRDLDRVLHELVVRLRTVREPTGVPEVDDVLVGQQVDERARDRQAAQAGVEDADGTIVVGLHARASPTPSSAGGTASSTSSAYASASRNRWYSTWAYSSTSCGGSRTATRPSTRGAGARQSTPTDRPTTRCSAARVATSSRAASSTVARGA